MSKVICDICPWYCELAEGEIGFCGVRVNTGGIVKNENYGYLVVASLDPIEKKPLKRFHPGSKILSIGANGCNLRCSFCQNFSFVMASKRELDMMDTTPEEVVETALRYRETHDNIGIAFTYNEPITMYDFMFDTARLSKQSGLLNIMVTNGYINEEPLKALLPYMDGMNIDLKRFTEEGYQEIGGHLEDVKRTIELANAACHVEVTALIVPGKNDDKKEIEEMAKWIASVNDEIPLHLTRFFPMYKLLDQKPTDIDLLAELKAISRKYLKYVYLGNV